MCLRFQHRDVFKQISGFPQMLHHDGQHTGIDGHDPSKGQRSGFQSMGLVLPTGSTCTDFQQHRTKVPCHGQGVGGLDDVVRQGFQQRIHAGPCQEGRVSGREGGHSGEASVMATQEKQFRTQLLGGPH